MKETSNPYEVIIIGGSYAGLSAAMALGRARRQVLVLDNGQPCNRQTPLSHNFLTRDGEKPKELAVISRRQVAAYDTITIVNETALTATSSDGIFTIETADGSSYHGRKILLATGMKDIPLPIDGFAECWGISVLHCPYCHGYEVRDEQLGVVASGPISYDFTQLIYQWSKQLTLFTNGGASLSPEQADQLARHNIPVVSKEIATFQHQAGYLQAIVFKDGSRQQVKAVFARGSLQQTSEIAMQLGCSLHAEGMATGLLQVDDFGKTNIPGVFAAGDNCSPMRSVANAVAMGNKAGAFINHELIKEDFLMTTATVS